MEGESMYTFKFVETVIDLMDSLSPNTRDRVFEWAANNRKSGIDSWRDFIVDHAENFERITSGIDWNEDPPTDYIDAIDAYGGLVNDAPIGALPTREELLLLIERNNELVRLERERVELNTRMKSVVGRILELTKKKGE